MAKPMPIAWPRRVVTLAAVWLACVPAAKADRILLRGGGQIKGVVVPSPDQPDQIVVQTETLTTPLKYRKDQVVRIIPEPSPVQDYLTKRNQTAQTAQAQYDLGLWCDEQKLSAYADLHYRKAIALDPGFGPAHKKLGHVLYNDKWLTSDQVREAQGLVKFKGRWVTKEEKAELENDAALAAERASWARRLKILRQAVLFGDPARKREAEGQLAAITDPAAVSPLVQAFAEDPEEQRNLLARVLGGISGKEASTALVNRLLAERESSVRQATMDELARRDEDLVLPLLIKALRAKDMAVVNRAAWAIGNMNAVSAVPKLVPVLIVEETKMVWVQTEQASGGSGIGASFVGGANYPYAGLNSVAVGPGSVGFGASAYPLYSGAGLSLGGGGEGTGLTRGYQPKFVRYSYRNTEVLSALERLTGQRFGFDTAAWRYWLRTAFQPKPQPSRTVPQP